MRVFLFFALQLVMRIALGAWVLGRLVDTNGGDYTTGWIVAAVLAAVTVPLALIAKPPTALQARHQAV